MLHSQGRRAHRKRVRDVRAVLLPEIPVCSNQLQQELLYDEEGAGMVPVSCLRGCIDEAISTEDWIAVSSDSRRRL